MRKKSSFLRRYAHNNVKHSDKWLKNVRCVCMRVHACLNVFGVFARVHAGLFVFVRFCVLVRVCTCLCVRVCVHGSIFYVCLCVRACVCVCA